MKQYDLFDETLSKKIYRMEKWVSRIQKEIWFLREVYNMSQKKLIETDRESQRDLFAEH